MQLKSVIRSLRLRTLPLSLSGIIYGIALSTSAQAPIHPLTLTMLVLTTIMLQILSNLSNELGDNLHGTDRDDRQGIRYSLQDGSMTSADLRRLIVLAAILCCCNGVVMVWSSFGTLFAWRPCLFLFLGAAAIWAATRYTLGDNPYGYRALGDLAVFLFFGLVSVLGAAYICCHRFDPLWLLPASSIGFFSMGVLNVNNLRDMKSDAATRTTVAILLGEKKTRIYQTLLITIGWLLLIVFSLFTASKPTSYLYCLTIPCYICHLHGVWHRSDRNLDPMLPLLVMSTFVTSILFLLTH